MAVVRADGLVRVAGMLLGAVALLGAAGCASSSAPSAEEPPPELSAGEQAYADSLAEWMLEGNEMLDPEDDLRVTQAQATCVGARFADAMGTDRLERYIPRDNLGGDDDQWGDADIRLESDEVAWMLEAQEACGIDERDFLAAGLSTADDPEQRACVRKQLDTALGQQMIEFQWGGDPDEYEAVYRDFFEALQEACPS